MIQFATWYRPDCPARYTMMRFASVQTFAYQRSGGFNSETTDAELKILASILFIANWSLFQLSVEISSKVAEWKKHESYETGWLCGSQCKLCTMLAVQAHFPSRFYCQHDSSQNEERMGTFVFFKLCMPKCRLHDSCWTKPISSAITSISQHCFVFDDNASGSWWILTACWG